MHNFMCATASRHCCFDSRAAAMAAVALEYNCIETAKSFYFCFFFLEFCKQNRLGDAAKILSSRALRDKHILIDFIIICWLAQCKHPINKPIDHERTPLAITQNFNGDSILSAPVHQRRQIQLTYLHRTFVAHFIQFLMLLLNTSSFVH